MVTEAFTQTEWEDFLRKETSSGINEKVDTGVWVDNKIFSEPFFHDGVVATNFTNCIFEEKVTFSSYSPRADIYITDCAFKKGLYLGGIESDHKIVFLNCSIDEPAVLSQIKIQRLELNLKYAKELIFDNNSSYGYLQMGGKERNKILKLHLSAGAISKRFEINHADIEIFNLGYSTLESELIVANSSIKSLTIDNFRNNGVIKFLNCNSFENSQYSEILINQSNMGKAEFMKFNFASFTKINITNSVILESLFINCIWSKQNIISKEVYFDSALETADKNSKAVLAENLKEVYKQIKYACYKQGDNVQEQFFHGLEMNEYYKTLSFRTDLWTKLILLLSSWTSNFGQSFIRPLISIIVVNILIFQVMYFLGATKFNSYQIFNLNNYWNTFASLLNFMNPLHKNDPELTGGPFILDTIARIFSSYFIYNIIRATRRFVK